ncbi:MAG: phosphatidylserine/phosphatidylglycerophosphate/cardiolipin synthase family protein [Gemmatimonadetes bacterium]|nr:phosphatidylserine/phosphatidylglycerophosphate/cardiolipin synthase family protein [Gemmatimonadota bacterium]
MPFVGTGAYPVRVGNAVRPLLDGAAAFRAICEAIDGAQARVWVTVTFLWAGFRMPEGRGSVFTVLERASQRGVEVRLLCWRPDEATAELRANAFWGSAGHFDQLRREAPGISVRWDRAQPGFCQHQKVWLVDAGLDTACAFVGSMNLNPHSMVAPGHAGAGQNHDVALAIRGPVVTDIQHNFVQRWNEASERHEADGRFGPGAEGELAFPGVIAAACGTTVAQVQRTIHAGRYTASVPAPGHGAFEVARGEYSIRDQYLEAIGAAREYVYLEQQAVSVRPILEALVAAVERGVVVVLVVPSVADRIHGAAEGRGAWLREARRVLALSPGFFLGGLAGCGVDGARHPVHVHAKLMIVDDGWATVGSCNLHRYSLEEQRLNVALADPAVVRAPVRAAAGISGGTR